MAEQNGQTREDLLIASLARGESFVRSARLSGLSERTVRRRMDNEDYRRQVQEARAKMVQSATGRLASAMNEAVLTLRHRRTKPEDMDTTTPAKGRMAAT